MLKDKKEPIQDITYMTDWTGKVPILHYRRRNSDTWERVGFTELQPPELTITHKMLSYALNGDVSPDSPGGPVAIDIRKVWDLLQTAKGWE